MIFSQAIKNFSDWKYLKVKPSTIYSYDGYLRNFCIFLRDPEIENIALEQIQEYLIWCQKMGFSASSREKKALAIKEFLDYYKRQEYKVVDPELIPLPQKEYSMIRVANEEDFKKLLRVIPENSNAYYHIRNRAIIWLLHDTGARIGELMFLNAEDLDLGRKCGIIKTAKVRGFPFRKIFWWKETNNCLKKWMAKRQELLEKTSIEEKNALFISVNGGVCGDGAVGRRMDIQAANEMLRKYSRLAGLRYVLNAHSFRHRLGHELAKRGANNSVISDILGHSDLESSKVYTRLFGDELEAIFRKIMVK